MSHPLDNCRIEGFGIKCFDENGSGVFHFSPVTVVIGKNNSGKSTVLDLIDILTNRMVDPFVTPSQKRGSSDPFVNASIPLHEPKLFSNFSQNQQGGDLPGNHRQYAQSLVGLPAVWRIDGKEVPSLERIDDSSNSGLQKEGVIKRLKKCFDWNIHHCTMLRVAAERSVVPEASNAPQPKPTGQGVTNLIRYFITSDEQPRDIVQVDLLRDLNKIYAGDAHFSEIVCQENQHKAWEIFLREDGKGDIRLSESGSSLQSVFIVLAYFRLVPRLDKIDWTRLILAVEEPENNLHPALLRRLVDFLAAKRKELGFSLVLTSHSPICIDWATRRQDAGIIHVTREGSSSKCKNVLNYNDNTLILDDLDVRGSDILQSNGVVWVEGPSDKIYLRKWIEILSDGQLKEGTHYTVMFYGGRILSHFEAAEPSDLSTLVSMVALNRNAAILMDSDRKQNGKERKPPQILNDTKRRLIGEIEDIGGMAWVTAGKEVENYVPDAVWKRLAGDSVVIKDIYQDIPNDPAVKKFQSTKVSLAHAVADSLSKDDVIGHLDLEKNVLLLMDHIKRWNSIA